MRIILHIGAHRNATTSFQYYLRENAAWLGENGIGFWGPARMRGGLLAGLAPGARGAPDPRRLRRLRGRVQLQLEKARAGGALHLLVSEENMLGSARHNLRHARLYPAAGERLARHAEVFGGRIAGIVLSVRSQELWWASAAASTVARGHAVPTAQTFARVAAQHRGWRDVITDIACAVPDVPITVAPFEHFAGRPQDLLHLAVGLRGPSHAADTWLGRSPDLAALRSILAQEGADPAALPAGEGRWLPFTPAQCAALREAYADDLHWLIAGADGLATLANDPTRTKTGASLHPGADLTEGRGHDEDGKGYLARSG